MNKTTLSTIFFLFIILNLYSQSSPQGINYQATVRGADGELIVNQNVSFKFNIKYNSPTANPIYTEEHYVPTDDIGQVNLIIGQGSSINGDFETIDWGLGNYFIGIELDVDASGYIAMGTTQLWSVPYALYAQNSGSSESGSQTLEQVLSEGNSAENNSITNLQDPQNAQDAVTKSYVDALVIDLQEQIDEQPPVISLYGEALVYVNQYHNFSDPGAVATDVQEGDLTNDIVVTGEVDTDIVDVYGLVYNVADSEGNNAFAVTRTIYVLDVTNPTITLLGEENIVIEGGSVFVDPGVTAVDAVDGDITANVVVSCEAAPDNSNSTVTNEVDTTILGDYVFIYTITDDAGNSFSVSRTVTVIDTTPPEVVYTGESTVFHQQHQSYSPTDYQLIDIIDGDISSDATFTYELSAGNTDIWVSVPSIDVDFQGTYKVYISGIDSSGNEVGPQYIYEVKVYCIPAPGEYTIDMQDNYGDGWNLGHIKVRFYYDDGTSNNGDELLIGLCNQWGQSIPGCAGLSSGTRTFTVEENVVEIEFIYVLDVYLSEVTFQIYGPEPASVGEAQLLGSYSGTDFGTSPADQILESGLYSDPFTFQVGCQWE